MSSMDEDLRDDLHFNLEATFQEVLRRREEQGAYSQEEYDQLVEDVIDEKISNGELSPDDDVEEWKEQLRTRWFEVQMTEPDRNDEE